MSLSRVTNKKVIERAIGRICREFARRGDKKRLSIGYQGGQAGNEHIYCVENAGIWFAYERRKHRNYHWCAYGVLPLEPPNSPSITIELNSPIQGINRRVQGFTALDGRGKQYLCHTGILGGSRPGIVGPRYIEAVSRPRTAVADTDGRTTQVFLIAEIGAARFIDQVAEYVRDVAAFKAGDYPAVTATAKLPQGFRGSDQEFEGVKKLPARSAGIASCDHGLIRNRLSALLKDAGYKTTRDQQRDLLVMRGRKPHIEFEIKSSADPQSVYTAVGQLFMHDAAKPVARRVVVLPNGVSTAITKAIRKLKIDLVTFRMTKSSIHYKGLDRIIPGVGSVAPIHLSE